ncbi:hypothetical protein L596_026662 [Steinernema carpocapsae]|uniref:Uncharacterized protein n=1 Tax=Steinernema carpocapsae TaxID=34508 RepID=A0A4U5M2Z9_STECR|nr:hypothetical protein L596_026662 [Steinernema carpocapsae]
MLELFYTDDNPSEPMSYKAPIPTVLFVFLKAAFTSCSPENTTPTQCFQRLNTNKENFSKFVSPFRLP